MVVAVVVVKWSALHVDDLSWNPAAIKITFLTYCTIRLNESEKIPGMAHLKKLKA